MYANLQELITHSGSTRRYFLSLPVAMQMQLHEHNAYIHSAAELHDRVRRLEAYNRAVALADSLKVSNR